MVARRYAVARDLMREALAPRAVLQLQAYVERTAGELLDPLLPTGRLEIMGDLARPLATGAIAELLGVPAEDRERPDLSPAYFARLVTAASAPGLNAAVAATAAAFPAYHPGPYPNPGQAYDHEPHPGSDRDLIGRLLSVEIEGERLTRDEVAASCYFFMTEARRALSDTLGNAMFLLSLQPDLLMRLRREPAPIFSTVEEILRYLPPVWTAQRTVISPVALDGVNLPLGANVRAWIVSANHDPEQFDHPERFDIDRIPNRHLSFRDAGTLDCLGSGLTRLVTRLTLAAVAQRVADLRLAPGDAVEVASPCEHGEVQDAVDAVHAVHAVAQVESVEHSHAANRIPDRCSLSKLDLVFESSD
jgi:cytochrome P450